MIYLFYILCWMPWVLPEFCFSRKLKWWMQFQKSLPQLVYFTEWMSQKNGKAFFSICEILSICSVPPIPWYRYRYRYRYPAEDPYRYRYRYRYPKIKPIPIPDTDTQNSYRYRYQIPIPSLRFIPIPIPISEKDV